MSYSRSKISLMDADPRTSLGNLPRLSPSNPSSEPTTSLLGNSIYSTNRKDALLRSSNRPRGLLPLLSPNSQSVQLTSLPNSSQYMLLKVDQPTETQPVQVMNTSSLLSPGSTTSLPTPNSGTSPLLSNQYFSSANLNNLIPQNLNNGGKVTPAGYSVEVDAAGTQHIIQHLIYSKDKKNKHGRHKDKKYSAPQPIIEETKSTISNEPPVGSILEHYLGRQNELMARLLKDLRDDKKLETLRQQELMEKINSSSGRYRSLPHFSSDYSQGNTFLMPVRLNNSYLPPYGGFYDDSYEQSRRMPAPRHDYYEPRQAPMQQPKMSLPRKKPHNPRRGKSLLRQYMWVLATPGLWFISVAKWAEKRRKEEVDQLRYVLPRNMEEFFEFAGFAIDKEIKKFIREKNSMVIVTEKAVSQKDMDARCTMIKDYLVVILDHLSLQISPKRLKRTFFEFLAGLSESNAVAPPDFFSHFEIQRLSFDMFGNLKYMDEWKSKMVLACFLLLKGITHFLIIKPWTVLSSISEIETNPKNLLNVGSVLYNIVVDILHEMVPKLHGSKCPFKTSHPEFNALENIEVETLEVAPPEDPNEIISGFYDKQQLSEFFRRPHLVQEVRESVLDFLDVLYDSTHKALEPKWHVKQRFADVRPDARYHR